MAVISSQKRFSIWRGSLVGYGLAWVRFWMWSIDWGMHHSLMISFSGLGIHMMLIIKYNLFIDYEFRWDNHSLMYYLIFRQNVYIICFLSLVRKYPPLIS
jgi:hypothetical protein